MMYKFIILIIALGFAWLGYKKTWYPAWSFLFNVIVAIYLGVMAGPQIVNALPIIRTELGDFAYSDTMLAIAAVYFIIAQLATLRYLTAVYCVSLPSLLNSIGAAVLGFFTGAAIAGFAIFLINISPPQGSKYVAFFTGAKLSQEKANRVVYKTCDFVHSISLQQHPTSVKEQMEKIFGNWQKSDAKTADANVSADINDVNTPPKEQTLISID
ncbi:MAG: hypothetical protein WC765_10600 [Phycisphaerae bacterium]|jgi:hypothetical protein